MLFSCDAKGSNNDLRAYFTFSIFWPQGQEMFTYSREPWVESLSILELPYLRHLYLVSVLQPSQVTALISALIVVEQQLQGECTNNMRNKFWVAEQREGYFPS